ncbi:hypothetical protein ZWY2020_048363 [Hordeum vulgare]|nr:hypothetical protein ZWY2020_048363 [Hordeum vulgare]
MARAPPSPLPPALSQGEYVLQFGSSFSWVISETARLVFSVPFPSVEILKVCTRDVIKCPIKKFLILIKKVEEIPDLVSPLEQVWVYIFGLPERDKRDHILKAVLEPVGKLLTADEVSLVGDGPARVEILC